MTDTLYIRTAASGGPYSWCLHTPVTGFGHVQVGNLPDALLLARDRRVVVFVPSTEITLTTVELPAHLHTAPQAKLLQALPYLLEDRLAEDVDTLHFAIGRRVAGTPLPVAIATAEQLQEWLKPFQDNDVTPTAIVPDVLCLPLVQKEGLTCWSVLLEGAQSIVRCGSCAGFSCETEMLSDFLSMTATPDNLHLQVYPVEHAESPELSYPIQTVASVRHGLEYMVRGYDDSHSINLMQGEFATTTGYMNRFQPWRLTAALLAGWLVLATVTHAIEYLRLRHELKGLEQTAETALRAAFPQVTQIIDLRGQAQQQLALLKRAGGSGGFMPLLQASSQALASLDGVELQEVQFREGVLHLALVAGDTQALDSVQQSFGQQSGVQLEVESANATGQGVQIRAAVKARP